MKDGNRILLFPKNLIPPKRIDCLSVNKIRQFYCYKFGTKHLAKEKFNIVTDFNTAKKSGEIIAINDNQILRTIRDLKGIVYDKDIVEELYSKRDFLKRQPSSASVIKEIREIQNSINHLLFYPEYVTISIDKMSHYDKIIKNGFKINGMTYRRLSCSAGQARSSTVLMCSEDIIDDVRERLNNDRDRTVPIAPSKLNAYFGLYSSSTQVVTEPRFCVVPDYTSTVEFEANYVTETDYKLDDIVTKKVVDLPITRTDGMGLISPYMAKQWASDLNLDYVPSQFIIRQSFLKGLVTVFDFHQFCEEKNDGNYLVKTVYKDENGEAVYEDLRECDIIVSESQFKLWNAYKSKQQYIESYRKNKIKWGVAQYAKDEYEDIVFLNYQFIQSLDLGQKEVEELCSCFKEWVEGVNINNIWYTLLFLVGQNTTPKRIQEYLVSWEAYWIKSLIVNHSLLNDKFIREKIYKFVLGAIKRAYLGGIPVKGNFQYLVTDPYAYMQWVCGQEITGLLGKDEHYSNYWNTKGTKTVDGMRAPLTHFSEHTILNLKKNEETEKWYKWCKNGIIFNWFGYEVCKLAGSDWDGDIICTTSNETMIKGVIHGETPVLYDVPKPEKISDPSEEELVKYDKFAMGSIIGQITNKGASAYAVLPLLEKRYGKDSKQYQLTLSRLKQTCCAQSKQIDKSKIGREVKGIPECWYKKNFFEDEEEREFNNSVLLDKRPYFFKYLYKDSKTEYNQYNEVQNYRSQDLFRKPLKQLLEQEYDSLTEEEKAFVDHYREYCPLIESDSCMNLLCRYIENIDFGLKQKIRNHTNNVDISLMKNKDVKYTDKQKKKVLKAMRDYNKWIQTCKLVCVLEEDSSALGVAKDYFYGAESNSDVIVNVLVDYCYEENKGNKELLWSVFGKEVFDNIMANTKEQPLYPFRDDNGDIEYLGTRFSLKGITSIE